MQTLMNASAVHRAPFASGHARRTQPRTVTCAATKSKPEQRGLSEALMRTAGALAAAHIALSAGPALADSSPVKAATDVGERAQQAIPEANRSPMEKEGRQQERDSGIANAVNSVKDRFDADKVAENANREDLFFNPKSKSKGVSYDMSWAPNLQVDVSEQLNKAASGAAQDAGRSVKEAGSGNTLGGGNPLDAAKDALGGLKGAGKDAVDSAKSAGGGAKGAAQEAGKNLPSAPKNVSFNLYEDLQIDVGNPVDEAKQAAQKAGSGGNPLDALKEKIDQASLTDRSPQKQLEKTSDKVGELKEQRNVGFVPGRGPPLFLADLSGATISKGSDAGQERSGGISQTRGENDPLASGKGSALLGGDLKDSKSNRAAAQNKPSDVGMTAAAQKDKQPRQGSKGLLRPDSESPEDAAQGNLAKAQQGAGAGPVDAVKGALGL